jgi:cell division protease FtsH
MVCEWGMSSDIGAVSYGQEDEPIFMGRELARHKMYSEETAGRIDAAVKKILDGACGKALALLERNRAQLLSLAERLFESETLSDSEIRSLLGFLPLAPAAGGRQYQAGETR